MALRRGGSNRDIDIWPGFVDALSSLLMAILFLVMIFVLGQFLLNDAISGRDARLARLTKEMTELGNMLALERSKGEDLRATIGRLSNQLQVATSTRDDLGRQLSAVTAQAEESAALVERLRSDLTKSNQSLEADRKRLDELAAQIVALQRMRDDLESDLVAAKEATKKAQASSSEEQQRAAKLAEEVAKGLEALKAAMAQHEQDTKQITAAQAQVQSLSTQADKLGQQLSDTRGQLADAQKQAADTASQLQAHNAQLEKNLADLKGQLADAQKQAGATAAQLQARNAQLEKSLADARSQLADAKGALTAAQQQATGTQQALGRQITSLQADLADRLAELGRLKTLADTMEEARKQLEEKLAKERERMADLGRQLGAQQDLTRASRHDVERLTQDVSTLRQEIARLNAALELSQASGKVKDEKIADLGQKLNAALARKVEQLERYRSEFFGKLREAIGNRPDVRVVGDRFVLPTEVLFPSGSATLEPKGRDAIGQVAKTLKAISQEIPPNIDWVLRVDGHTDAVPIATDRFPSNWELSTARALAVVHYLVDQGLPPNRLVAAGFGEYQPIDPTPNSEIANRRNRRIEFKLTER